jgi:hypothetical protein
MWPAFRRAAGIDGIAASVDVPNAVLAAESMHRAGAPLPAGV